MSLFIASNERFIRITLIFYDPFFGTTRFVVSTSIYGFSLNTKRSIVEVFYRDRFWPSRRSLPPEETALRDTKIFPVVPFSLEAAVKATVR